MDDSTNDSTNTPKSFVSIVILQSHVAISVSMSERSKREGNQGRRRSAEKTIRSVRLSAEESV